jgi:hypothetical protein
MPPYPKAEYREYYKDGIRDELHSLLVAQTAAENVVDDGPRLGSTYEMLNLGTAARERGRSRA